MTDLEQIMETWEPVIGLEIHVQLGTQTKAFSSSKTTFGAPPNTLTDPTVLGLPGALPTFNKAALEAAIRLGVATSSKIRARSRFARKHYFYPDLPKGYQISQYDEPLCEDGSIEMFVPGTEAGRKRVRLIRIHLEEDAGKSTHAAAASLVDLNRAGIPLCEVVTHPELASAEEAAELMRQLNRLVRYLGISEGDMEKGQMRCDANVSVRRRGEDRLGTRTELKNINSFRFVQKAIEHEFLRQVRILEEGGTVVQETRLWDADQGASFTMRTKEEANDYRYLPDPDLPPLVVDGPTMATVMRSMPELPMQKVDRFQREYGLRELEARQLVGERTLADFFDEAVRAHGSPQSARMIASWIANELSGALNAAVKTIEQSPVTPAHVASLVRLIENDTISGKMAKDVFDKTFATGQPPEDIVEREGLRQISDPMEIERVARAVLAANDRQVAAFRAGKDSLFGFFVGQVMKETGGRANPQITSDVLRRLLS
jgi:aspartyl-tRNA(Asn)/glutamyl-tRNA(Gln) amidotransferase subunit B